jgi:hypothetical protein
MNWKMALVVSALASVGGAFAALGCGSDECTRADDHFADCHDNLGLSTSSSSSGNGPSEECAGSRLCHSQCINTYSCPQITGNDSEYTRCIAKCNSE